MEHIAEATIHEFASELHFTGIVQVLIELLCSSKIGQEVLFAPDEICSQVNQRLSLYQMTALTLLVINPL